MACRSSFASSSLSLSSSDEEDDEEDTKAKPTAGDAFEDVLYGSESELGDSDDEMPSAQQQRGGKRKDGGARLRVDDDEPMDLLAGAASRITSECKICHFNCQRLNNLSIQRRKCQETQKTW